MFREGLVFRVLGGRLGDDVCQGSLLHLEAVWFGPLVFRLGRLGTECVVPKLCGHNLGTK